MKSTVIMPDGRRITTMELSDLLPLSEKEKAQIRTAAAHPAIYDADCPPIPEEMIAAMEQAIQNRTAMCIAHAAAFNTLIVSQGSGSNQHTEQDSFGYSFQF